jgi:hypothetical protein
MRITISSAMQNAQDPRLQEYLDDKLQTLADFEGLDSLLQHTRTQQSLLKKQVCLHPTDPSAAAANSLEA